MGTITAVVNLTLDGVMQAPGRADEDTRNGFTGGGWAHPYADPVQGRVMGEHMAAQAARESALLFGRRTYQDFHGYWPNQTDNPFTEVLDKSEKLVASRTLTDPLPWQNSTLLSGDAVTALREVFAERPGLSLVVLGSGELLRSLMRAGMIDEYLLSIHPLTVGPGTRLFEGVNVGALRLVQSVTTTTGVLIATYRPAGEESL
ncbi:dihydrofolate reductase family protein [Nocardia sp. CDC153]|uniref:dihydrofolate reductase family protein n=1 Tax=Nocardia sp. CDC153 TaxID=3112167 RepID=UPI002DBE32D6|nr:dihydrofolate reductase family protein [Nocardia sp. CDC153]MEC3954096.1 dihydrofolate reductase family protein [Nocardia sp. CDC153]